MYLKAFDRKWDRATVQRGYSLIQLLVVMLLVSILATAAFTVYRESVRSANLRAAHAALLENARFMEQFYTKKGSFKLTSTKWPELPVNESLTAVVCGKMKGKGSCTDGEEIFRGNDAECRPFTG